MNVLITGAAGNLGGLLASHLRGDPSLQLVLMVHTRDVAPELKCDPRVRVVRADLARRKPFTLRWRALTLSFISPACREIVSFLFNVRSPLTRDFITIGMVSYYGDTSRMRKELLKELKYGNFREGSSIL